MKKFGVMLLLFVLVFSFGVVSAACEDGRVGYWKFDDGAGVSAVDSSDSGFDGALEGSALWVGGKIGGALSFSGSGRVNVGNSQVLRPDSEMSVEFLIKTTDAGNDIGAIFSRHWYAYETPWWSQLLRVAGGRLDFGYVGGAGGMVSQGGLIADGNWHHVVALNDGSMLKIYVDGVLDGSLAVSGTFHSSSSNTYIGNSNWAGSAGTGYFNGIMDEVAFYNRALSEAEIVEHYSKIQTGVGYCANLDCKEGVVSYWKFDDVLGTSAVDASGHLNGGTISGVSLAQAGKVGTAFGFDGSSVNKVTAVSNDWAFTTEDFSLSAWVNLNDVDSRATLMEFTGGGAWQLLYFDDKTGWTFDENVENTNTIVQECDPGNYGCTGTLVRQWTFVTMTRNGNVWKLYVNGAEIGAATDDRDIRSTSELSVGYGVNYRANGEYFNGSIDEVAIWDKGLSAAEVSELYSMGMSGEGYCDASCHSDDFEDLVLDSNWNVLRNDDNGYSLSGGKLVIDVLGVGTDSMTPSHVWLESVETLYGDFEVEMDFSDYERYGGSFQNGNINLRVNFSDGALTYWIKGLGYAPGDVNEVWYMNPSGDSSRKFRESNDDSAGNFKIRREGNELTYYYNGVENYSETFPSLGNAATVSFDVGTGDLGENVRVNVDNFKVGYGCDEGSGEVVCGDGNVGVGEQCDDSNLVDGDGCNSTCQDEPLTGEIYWADMDGVEINSTDLGDTVQMIKTYASSGSFDIFEDDHFLDPDDDIRDDIVGVEIGGNLVGEWTIIQDDLRKTIGDYDEFRFIIDGETSDALVISPNRDDDKMIIDVENPICGSYFDVGATEQIRVVASDADDKIYGSLKISGAEIADFSNNGFVLDHPFLLMGNIQIIAEANNTRGHRSRSISSVMVLDRTIDGKYSAACIDSPKNFEDFEDSTIPIDASTSRAVNVSGSGADIEVVYPGDSANRLNWYWTFSKVDPRTKTGAEGALITAYNFTVEFPNSGGNWATLKLDLV